MALVNPNIAMSYKPTTEYQPRNALAEYAQIQQIQGGQMQMAKLKRDEEALDTMMQTITAKGGPSDPMVAADAMIKSRNPNFMAAGLAIQQTHRDTQQTRAALGLPPLRGIATPNATPINALSPTPPTSGALGSGTFDPMAPAAPVAPTNAMVSAAAPVAPTNAMVPAPAGGMSPEVMRAYEMLASPSPAVQKAGEMKLKELTESQVVPSGGTVFQGGKPIYTAPKERTSTLRTSQELDQEMQIRAAGRSTTPRAEPAPSIAQIEDPNNPGRMITIDARRYVPGTNVGVIGSSGKTTAAAKAEEKTETGKSQLQDELDTIRAAYQNLETMRAIPSTERSGVSNVASSIAASGLGQTTGRVFGTKEQVERDVISSSRYRLLNAVKQATGKGDGELNSNVELQTMLNSLSDPSQATQTVDRIISAMEDRYVKGQGMQKPAAPANIDALLDKYK